MPLLELLRLPRREIQPIPAFESATAELIAGSYAPRTSSTLYTLTAFLIIAIAFMCFFQLDRIVKTPGRMMPIDGAITVQPLEQQIIKRILVRVGDIVKKNQVLAVCDPTFAQADLLALRQKVSDLDSQVRRAEAEIAEKPFAAASGDPYDAVQMALWRRRQTEFTSGVADFDQRIAGANAQLTQLRQDIASFKEQLVIARKVEDMNTALEKPGYVSQLELLTAQNSRVTTQRSLVDSQNGYDAASHLRDSTLELRKVFIDKWHEDVLTELVANKALLEQAQQDLIKAQKVSDLVDLVAPEDSVVINVPKLSTGSVAGEAQPLFGLVPLNATLQADVQVDAQDIGFVQVGDKVTIKLDAYKYLEHGTVQGEVKTIGTDTLTAQSSEDTGMGVAASPDATRTPYYDARVEIKAIQLRDVPADAHLIAGMTLQADIIVGHRTIMWYLMGSAMRSGAEAMHEP